MGTRGKQINRHDHAPDGAKRDFQRAQHRGANWALAHSRAAEQKNDRSDRRYAISGIESGKQRQRNQRNGECYSQRNRVVYCAQKGSGEPVDRRLPRASDTTLHDQHGGENCPITLRQVQPFRGCVTCKGRRGNPDAMADFQAPPVPELRGVITQPRRWMRPPFRVEYGFHCGSALLL